ncbi:MAG: alpha/beta fold hydrolase [Nitrospirota bacterium]
MEEPLVFRDPDGHRVSAVLAAPSPSTDRAVVLCHGFLSNKNSTTNRTLTAELLPKGIATFRFDFFGQGESEGPFEQTTVSRAVGQALTALDLVASRGYKRIGLVGSSFGGLVAILAAGRWTGRGASLACLGLKCPVPDFEEMLRLEFGPEGLVEWKKTGTIPDVTGGPGRVKLHYGFYEDCARHRGYEAAPGVKVPTLIVQGEKDEYASVVDQSRRLFEALPGPKELHVLPGADHGFSKPEDFRTMVTLLVGWMIRYLQADDR